MVEREEQAVRRYDDPVEVRRSDEDPDQFLWRGRLWQVREVIAHWVETGAWWEQQRSATATDLLAEKEVWRVAAARGRAVNSVTSGDDPGFGVFDLTFDWAQGDWRLVRTAD